MGYQPAKQFSVLKGVELLEDVRHEAKKTKSILWGQTMEYEPGEITDALLAAFTGAAARGVNVKLNIDYYMLHFTDAGFNHIPLFNKKREDDRKKRVLLRIKALHFLREANIDIQLINKPDFLMRLFPTKGRNHMKMILTDTTAWIGGINFHDFNLACDDFMVKLTDPDIVSFLKKIYIKNHDKEKLYDQSIQTGEDTTLLIDGGKPGQSLIMSHAVNMIKNAESSVYFSSAFYPNGDILRALHTAYRNGLDVKIVVPDMKNVSGVALAVNRSEIFLMHLLRQWVPLLKNKRKMHSKLIIIDDKKALFGSHNFSSRGVRMGTAELAMETTNETLVKNLKKYFTYLLTGTEK